MTGAQKYNTEGLSRKEEENADLYPNATTLRYARRKERKTDRSPPCLNHNLQRSSPLRCSCILVVLLHLVDSLLVNLAFSPCCYKALPNGHIRLCLCQQRVADILLAAACPAVEALEAQRPDGHVALAAHVFESNGRGLCSNAVNVHFQLLTEGLERQIVHVVTKGILNFATDGGETENDVRSENGTGNGDPLQRFV